MLLNATIAECDAIHRTVAERRITAASRQHTLRQTPPLQDTVQAFQFFWKDKGLGINPTPCVSRYG